jgi:hypothetical protein
MSQQNIYYKNDESILDKVEFTEHRSENKRDHIHQEPTQMLLRNYISKVTPYESVLLYHSVGVGKCHKVDTPILMYDGTTKLVQNINIGEYLMGDDSTPRQVLSLARGVDNMYDIIPVKGDKYTVNEEHILCLKASGLPCLSESKINHNFNVTWVENNKFQSRSFNYNNSNKSLRESEAKQFHNNIKCEQIIEISVKDYLKLSTNRKSMLKGYRSSVEFKQKDIEIDPYMIGYWLGDGTARDSVITCQDSTVLHYFANNLPKYNLNLTKRSSDYCYGITGFTGKVKSNVFLNTLKELNLINNKHIPHIYKCNSRENRLKLLAGLIDSDGSYSRGMFEISQSDDHEKLMDDIIYLVRSLGFACYKTLKKTSWTHNGIKKHKTCWRITISGNGIEEIPTKIPRKRANPRKQKKNVLVTGIKVIPVGRDNYYGFTLDGNCRYLMGDFTVTHNTCAAITIAEGFKEYINNMGKSIVVLVKNKNIEKNFVGELMSKCTREEYLDDEEYDIYSEKIKYRGSESDRKEIVHRANKAISKSYQFITYGTFINRVLGAKQFEKDELGQTTKKVKRTETGEIKRKRIKDEIKNLNNTVIIVDEAHNITGNEVYTALMQILSKSYNYRLILLTATPMYDNSTEIFELSNLLNTNNKNLQLPTGNSLSKADSSGQSLLTKKRSEYINRSALKGDIYEITEYGKQRLTEALKGKVSYLKANTETNPEKIEKGEPLITNIMGTTNIVLCEMTPYQYKVYIQALKTDLGQDSKYDMSTAIKMIEANENISENEVGFSKASSLYKNSSDASTMTYPEYSYGKIGFQKVFSKSGNKYSTINKQVLTTDLKTYSCKLWTLLQNINKRDKGNVFIYTNYVNYGGTSLLRQLFINNGFYEYFGKNTKDIPEERYYKNFVVFDEGTSLNMREQYKRVFNSDENKDGKHIRIIIGSPIIAEGITLKAVRQVHIIEPYWNMSKINQIIGRAIRNYSHHALPENKRNVEIFKYVSVFYKEGNTNLDSSSDSSKFFIDREKYILSEEKDRSNKIIERLLKTTSFDCDLNMSRNRIIHGVDGSPECDYTNCDYSCNTIQKSNRIDKSTYKMYLTFFDQFDIFYVLETIKAMFTKGFIWHLDDIQRHIHNLEPLITDEAIYTTLNHIVENKVYIVDKYGREGFVIRQGEYYIFNDSDIDIESSVYSKILDFSVDINKYSLNEYSKKSLLQDLFVSKKAKGKAKETEETDSTPSEIDLLSEQDLEYNRQIEENYPIYGTYRMKKGKNDTWEHKYGKRDEKFRILDLRKTSSKQNKDQRKDITGKAATSYEISDLRSVARALELEVNDTHQKSDLIKMIKRVLEKEDRVLK